MSLHSQFGFAHNLEVVSTSPKGRRLYCKSREYGWWIIFDIKTRRVYKQQSTHTGKRDLHSRQEFMWVAE